MIFWDLGLTLFDIPKDVVFAEILVLSNIFGFLAVHWALKWTKTVNFGCIPFEPKFKILKDFSNTVFLLLEDYLCSKFQQNWTACVGVRARTPLPHNFPKKGAISWMLNQYEKLRKFLTSQPQMLFWRNLSQIYIWIRSFIWQNLGA